MHKHSHTLKGLDDISVENLSIGRITQEALHHAIMRAHKLDKHLLEDYHLSEQFANSSDRMIANELNDMLEAARHLHNRKAAHDL